MLAAIPGVFLRGMWLGQGARSTNWALQTSTGLGSALGPFSCTWFVGKLICGDIPAREWMDLLRAVEETQAELGQTPCLRLPWKMLHYKIREVLRLEKTFRVTKANH